MLTSQHRHLSEDDFVDGLRGKAANLPGTTAIVADKLALRGLVISFADVVLHAGGGAGQVIGCALEAGALFVIVEVMELSGHVSPQSAKWRCTKTQNVWAAEAVQLALAWYSDGELVVV